jgi:hypothetical protein
MALAVLVNLFTPSDNWNISHLAFRKVKPEMAGFKRDKTSVSVSSLLVLKVIVSYLTRIDIFALTFGTLTPDVH